MTYSLSADVADVTERPEKTSDLKPEFWVLFTFSINLC